jgi:hypothetical protein
MSDLLVEIDAYILNMYIDVNSNLERCNARCHIHRALTPALLENGAQQMVSIGMTKADIDIDTQF